MHCSGVHQLEMLPCNIVGLSQSPQLQNIHGHRVCMRMLGGGPVEEPSEMHGLPHHALSAYYVGCQQCTMSLGQADPIPPHHLPGDSTGLHCPTARAQLKKYPCAQADVVPLSLPFQKNAEPGGSPQIRNMLFQPGIAPMQLSIDSQVVGWTHLLPLCIDKGTEAGSPLLASPSVEEPRIFHRFWHLFLEHRRACWTILLNVRMPHQRTWKMCLLGAHSRMVGQCMACGSFLCSWTVLHRTHVTGRELGQLVLHFSYMWIPSISQGDVEAVIKCAPSQLSPAGTHTYKLATRPQNMVQGIQQMPSMKGSTTRHIRLAHSRRYMATCLTVTLPHWAIECYRL